MKGSTKVEIKRFYLACLAHASYLIHDGREAAVIDPQRDVDLYIEEVRQLGLRIRWVIETHLHADFVSGHFELASRTGATICLGAGSGALFDHRALNDSDELPLGKSTLRILSTPGHTEESICIVAYDPGAIEPCAVFTGDTLFIGDVGRPDLSPTKTPQELAGMLFDSLHNKLMTLPDDTLVYPAHGAGSLCGRQMSSDDSSTIGRERSLNYALQPKDRDQFVSLLTAEMPPRPGYFQKEVARNRAGAVPIEKLEPLHAVSPDELLDLRSKGAVVLDTRPAAKFAAAHVPGSINIGLSGQFASWAARMLGIESTVVLVAEDDEALEQSRIRLARVGLENVVGYLANGILGWDSAGKPTQSFDQISVQDLAESIAADPEAWTIVDVRETSERTLAGSIPHSISIPLPDLSARFAEIGPNANVAVHCKGGYRSAIAASILQASGINRVFNIVGGYDAWALTFPPGTSAQPVGAYHA
jgi:glyoxylase-like metal-dependent hydrolase (beta-lactamase superfamily II)/rhodanese-related sulfurtransferase